MSEAPAVFDLARDVVAVGGPESGSYLQGQLSQDVLGIPDGGSAWSWLLAPSGKVDALVRVTRLSGEEWLLDTDAGWGEAVLTRLNRFKLRTKVELSPSPLQVVGLRSPRWEPPAGAVAVLSPPWPGVEGADVVCPRQVAAGLAPSPAALYEPDRVAAGIPRMGAELDERTIPGETGLVAITASFTKGCYTGQELVARVDSRGGNVPRRLRILRFAGIAGIAGSAGEAGTVAAGDDLVGPDGRAAGTVTSVAESARHGRVGLGYVKRGFDLTDRLETSPGGVPVEQVELKL